MNVFKKTMLATLFLVSPITQASIISGSHMTDDGKVVNLSGLEWLSFDDDTLGSTTIDVARDSVVDSNSIWSLAGWRIASRDEFHDLYDSLGLNYGENSTNNDGIDWMIDNLGSTEINDEIGFGHGLPGDRDAYSSITGFYSGAFDVHGQYLAQSFTQDYTEWFSSSLTGFYPLETEADVDTHWLNSTRAYNTTGTFLVREASVAVPEPSIVALISLGLMGLGFTRRKQH